jgi:LuxR family maltose regulon positive regulatory protein
VQIGSAGWFTWLDDPATQSFTFEDAWGRFTARKERRQRGSQYWIAYRKAGGKLRNAYLGKAADLTLERLQSTAAALAATIASPGPSATPDLHAGVIPTQRSSRDNDSAPPPIDRSLARNNLPALLTSFIGREQELAALHELIGRPAAGVRLLTLTGPGGTGKTRLGLEAAKCLLREAPDLFPDGIFFVPLSTIDDPNLVVTVLAQTLGVRESGSRGLVERLRDFVRARQMLLLLDNFEQVAAAAPLVAELLAVAPGLRVIITSRALLHLYGEHEYPVPPLALPDPEHMPPVEELTQCAAVALFAERARAANPNFALNAANAAAVAAICVRLDGLPLAIELAAARSKLFAPAALLARLDRRLTFLTGQTRDLAARQQTLRATIDWSYDLLTEAEQTLFARLAVFAGPFTLEAAEAVASELRIENDEVSNIKEDRAVLNSQFSIFNLIESLVNQSMVRQLSAAAADGEPQFRLLLTLREYAWERLDERGETQAVQRRHADYFLRVAEQAELELRGPQQVAWLERLEGEHDNFRTALVWTLARQDAEKALRLSGALWRFWELHSHLSEGRRWLMAALQKAEGRRTRPARNEGMKDESAADSSAASFQQARAKALHGAGKLANDQGDSAVGQALCEESLALLEELGDERSSVMVRNSLGIIAQSQHDYDRAAAQHEASLVVARRLEDRVGAYVALYNLAEMARAQGDYQRAVALHEESLALKRVQGDLWSIAWSLVSLGQLVELHGDQTRAAALYRESLTLRWPLGDKLSLAESLTGLAGVAAVMQQPERAARLCGAVESLLGTIGASLSSLMLGYHDRTMAAARAQLDGAAFAVAWESGRALSLDQAMAYALEREPAAASDRSSVPHQAMPVSVPAAGTSRAATSSPADVPVANLLAIKLHVPLVQPNLVPRPRLIARLRAGMSGKLTLIAAPAGFGKSTLLATWLANLPTCAWLSLDASDNDPTRFWSYLSAALDTIAAGVGASALALLQAPQPPPIEVLLTTLLNAISTQAPKQLREQPGVLVLDDYHLIEAQPIHQALTTLIDYLPPHVHLVVASRTDPPLPLSRWRARGALVELRTSDLRFTSAETAAFLVEMMGLPLSAADSAALEARTEGWIAGLQLAALALRERTDAAEFIRAFTGSNRFVVDYLAEEVIARQPAHLQAFLLQTCILDRMCGPLCDTVLGVEAFQHSNPSTGSRQAVQTFQPPNAQTAYSQLLLEHLERANVFTIALDDERCWYRYHHLFADVLRERLQRGATQRELITFHERASRWYAQHNLVPEAIQHMLAACNWTQAALLIEQHGLSIMFGGQVHTVIGWMRTFPDTIIRARPALCAIHALTLMFTNRLDAAEIYLQEAERGAQAAAGDAQARTILGWVTAFRTTILRMHGDLAASLVLARQTLDLVPDTEVIGAAARVTAAYSFLISGDVTTASEQQVRVAVATARAAGFQVSILRSLNLLARLQTLQGRLRAAAATYSEAAQVAPEPDALRMIVNSAAYYFGLGDLLREWNDLEAAERHLLQGLALVQGELTIDAEVVTRGYLVLARLQQACGQSGAAIATLDVFLVLANERAYVAPLLARGAAAQAQARLMQGDLPAAAWWAAISGLDADAADLPYPQESEYLTLARVLIARNQLELSLGLLERLLHAAEANARIGSAIEVLVLQALAHEARGDRPSALTVLKRALILAAPEGYIRIFVDEGAPMAGLLQAAHARGIAPDYVKKLLAAFPLPDKETSRHEDKEIDRSPDAPGSLSPGLPVSMSLVEPLTPRELEVLRLLAAGRSNQAIADELVVAIGTVKRHVNSLCGKLGVPSRLAAVARARDLGLL